MTDNQKPDITDLIEKLPTPGWKLTPAEEAGQSHTLEEAVRTAHSRHAEGNTPGLISEIESRFEVDMLQLQELWMHLGLPM